MAKLFQNLLRTTTLFFALQDTAAWGMLQKPINLFLEMILSTIKSDILANNQKKKKIQEILKSDPEIINLENNSGSSPLKLAVKEKNFALAKFLLNSGAEITDHVIKLAKKTGNKKLIELLQKPEEPKKQ